MTDGEQGLEMEDSHKLTEENEAKTSIKKSDHWRQRKRDTRKYSDVESKTKIKKQKEEKAQHLDSLLIHKHLT